MVALIAKAIAICQVWKGQRQRTLSGAKTASEPLQSIQGHGWLVFTRKELVNEYIELMHQGKSLDKIKNELHINKKTAFDWRHKILASIEDIQQSKFSGIIESDETFFLQSDKGKRKGLERTARKRGGHSSSRGISNDQVAVITTADRKGALDF